MVTVGLAILCAALTVGLRVLPRLRRPDFGVDAWYYLSYARAWRRQRRWPVALHNYALDDERQVYPPGLPWLLARLPTSWLERGHWCISAVIDGVHCLVLCAVVWALSGSLTALAVAGALFATSPVLVAQATELNARPLGALLFTIFMLCLRGFETGPGWGTAIVVGLAGLLILWTHKMTTQQMAAALLAWAVIDRDPRWLVIGVAMVAASFVLSGGWFTNLVRGHRDIIRFWQRNRPFLGAHQVYQSPLYADAGKAHAKRGVVGVRGSRVHRALAVAHLGAVAALTGWLLVSGLAPEGSAARFLVQWVAMVFVTVAATTWVPGLTQFGEGFKYLRYGVFAWSAAIALWSASAPGLVTLGVVAVLLMTQALVTARILAAQSHNFLAAIDGDVRAAVEDLRRQPEDGVLALPVTQSEAIAYFTGKRVLWGAHGTGWHRIEPFWPVLRRPLEAFLGEYGLRWLWIDARYVDVADLKLPPASVELWQTRGPIQLFRVLPGGA